MRPGEQRETRRRISARFWPRRRATPAKRAVALFLVGPLLWVVALIAIAFVVKRSDVVEIGLLITAASIAVALVFLVPMRLVRRREEEKRA
jgi:hypothetical protein